MKFLASAIFVFSSFQLVSITGQDVDTFKIRSLNLLEWKQLVWKTRFGSFPIGKENTYGLGWGIGNNEGIRTIGHSGGQAGTSTMLTIMPDHDLDVAVMCNLQRAPSGILAFEIAKSTVGSSDP